MSKHPPDSFYNDFLSEHTKKVIALHRWTRCSLADCRRVLVKSGWRVREATQLLQEELLYVPDTDLLF